MEVLRQTVSILAFLLLFGGSLSVDVSSADRIVRETKHGYVSISAHGSIIHVTVIKKRDNFQQRSTLHAKLSADDPRETIVLIPDCGTNAVCASSNNETHTRFIISPESDRVEVYRRSNNPSAVFTDCHDFGSDVDWFGGPQLRYQHWPIQKMYFEEEPYVPTHPVNMALSERYWLNSKGIYYSVYHEDPLFLDQNNYKANYLCFTAQNKAPYRKRDHVTLTYRIGVHPDSKMAHLTAVNTIFGRPEGLPNERMVQHPIWSTWARYKANVSSDVVNEFADEILAQGFNNSQLEIDDNWETCYGSAEFHPQKFPNVSQLTERLQNKGFRVTLWIHPFINQGCEPAFSYAKNNSYFVKNLNGEIHTQWWQGSDAAVIDFTNANAVTWWVGRLKKLEKLGINSFKFDAGEISWLPQVASLNSSLESQPGIFTKKYVESLAGHFDDSIEVRVGWRSQNLPIFVRMIDKDTRWSMNNGLPTLITTLLQMNMNGYVYVLPDMIGGNGYLNNSLTATELPSKELFIRWLQANVFMPSLQYSFVPWDYDEETVNISRKFTNLHAEVATPYIIDAMKKAITAGHPVNSPIWFADPDDKFAYGISDEYLLGENILVAPVVEEGATSRNIYLPVGIWVDRNERKHFGPILLENYPAPLDVLPYFRKFRS